MGDKSRIEKGGGDMMMMMGEEEIEGCYGMPSQIYMIGGIIFRMTLFAAIDLELKSLICIR